MCQQGFRVDRSPLARLVQVHMWTVPIPTWIISKPARPALSEATWICFRTACLASGEVQSRLRRDHSAGLQHVYASGILDGRGYQGPGVGSQEG